MKRRPVVIRAETTTTAKDVKRAKGKLERLLIDEALSHAGDHSGRRFLLPVSLIANLT
jgi:hypothetical protein